MTRLIDAMHHHYAEEMICRVCTVDQPPESFSDWGRKRSECRTCVSDRNREYGQTNKARRNERLREWRRKNPEAARAKDRRAALMSKYRLTESEVEAMREAQGGRCCLCDRGDRMLVVDHCHESGRVRGLLCRACNTLVGQIESTPTILERVVGYLDDHGNTTSGLASSKRTSA